MKILLFYLLGFLSAAFAEPVATEQAHTRVRFLSANEFLQPGKVNQVGLHFSHDPEWHTYWLNPGDSASAPIFNWQTPTGVTVSAPRFPIPQRLSIGHLSSFVFAGESTIIFDVEVPADYPEDEVTLVLNAEWVVCKVECLPAAFQFKKSFSVKSGEQPTAEAHLFSPQQGLWPVQQARVKVTDRQVGIRFRLPEEYTFKDVFPYPSQPLSNLPAERSTQYGEQLEFWLDRNPHQPWLTTDLHLLVVVEDPQGHRSAIQLVGKGGEEVLWFMALLAFLGGIILNLMPCVFPVLTLKVFAIARALGQDRDRIRNEHLFYVLGVMVSFWVFAGALIALQKAGATVGWGFQLQSPIFVGLLALLFLAMGCYFLDLLPLNLARFAQWGDHLTHQQGWVGAFFTGVLAVVVASPCTAPFMGAAIGYGLSRTALEVFIIFTGLGLGLAAPFIALLLWPESLASLPQPGRWMEMVKKLMAIPMLATALWLTWVLSLQLASSPRPDQGIWQNFSPPKLTELIASNKPVFVNFTAAWCISCQVNEQVVFHSQRVLEHIKTVDLTMLKADWTNRDDEIGQVLRNYGRAGVPLYLYFAPGRSQPEILPEILTPNIFLNRVTGR